MLNFHYRLRIVKIFFGIVFLVFVVRLFQLQILNGNSYQATATAQQQKKSIIPAHRGKILVKKNRFTNETIPLATNNTLQMLFVDPLLLTYPRYDPNKDSNEQERGDPRKAAELLAPLLIHAHCEKIENCDIETNPNEWTASQKIAIDRYQRELERIFNEIQRREVVLMTDIADIRAQEIERLGIRGIRVKNNRLVADPVELNDLAFVTEQLSPLIGMAESRLKRLLQTSYNRYTEITHKIVPEVSSAIWELKKDPQYREILRGVQLSDEYWRYYPEKFLAAQVLGFIDGEGTGQYGLEGYFDNELKGRAGSISGATNTRGQRIFGKNLGLEQAKNGVDLQLTIDRFIQGEVEKILAEDLAHFDADAAQVIVLEPKTGKVLAMVNAPLFDPNNYGEAYLRYEIPTEQETTDRENELFNQRIPTSKDGNSFYRYFNDWGPEVFRNKSLTDEYEPGSVIKALTMSVALNSDEVTPQTTYDDNGPIEVDEFKIRNSDEVYAGKTNMIEVIDRSLNTGIAFITQKMGARMVYESFRAFGFGEYTDINFPGEAQGQLEYWSDWEESELVTRGFGQGFTANLLQVALSFGSLANGGYLMKPILVEKIIHPDGTEDVTVPERKRRIISEESSQTTRAMLLSAVKTGTGRAARINGYSVLGKTGTSQTYKNGKVQTGLGTTIATFAGLAPMEDPQFVIVVKYDYPKLSQWGSETAAVTFRKITQFLFDYYKLPPDY
jgi:cell division protein FtsI/penicillin-binding protein 2